MKYTFLLSLIILGLASTANAQSAAYLKIDGVEGEATIKPVPARAVTAPEKATGGSTSGTVTAPGTGPQEASGDYYIKIPDIKGESGAAAPGVEPDEIDVSVTGKSATMPKSVQTGTGSEMKGIDPDEIDFKGDNALTPSLSILLGGGSEEAAGGVNVAVGDVNGLTDTQRSAAAHIILSGLQEEGAPMESLSLNYTKIEMRMKEEVKLFGFIPLSSPTTVEIDESAKIVIQRPWWSFLAFGKSDQEHTESITKALSNVFKSKHDALMSAIQNTR